MARDWSRTLLPASLGGAPFHVRSTEREVGRRHADHTIPNGGHVVEEFGAKTNRFECEAYCVGDLADAQAELLLSVAESPGPHLLVLPTRAVMVTVDSARSTFERDGLGRIMVRISAIDAGPVSAPGFGLAAGAGLSLAALDNLVFVAADVVFDGLAGTASDLVGGLGLAFSPAASVIVDGLIGNALVGLATVEVVRDLVVSTAVAAAGFEAVLGVVGLPSEMALIRSAAEAAIGGDLVDLSFEIAGAAETVGRLGSAPGEWASEVGGMVRALGDVAAPDLWPRQADRLLDLVPQVPPLARETPVSRAGARAAAVAPAILRVAAVASVVEGVVRRSWPDRPSAVAARAAVADLVGDEVVRLGALDPVPGATIRALVALRDAAVAALMRRATTLAPVMTITSTVVRPALAWAWDLYGDPSRAAEIVARNRLDHASLVPLRFEVLAN